MFVEVVDLYGVVVELHDQLLLAPAPVFQLIMCKTTIRLSKGRLLFFFIF